jgi:hypothetical protein
MKCKFSSSQESALRAERKESGDQKQIKGEGKIFPRAVGGVSAAEVEGEQKS